MSSNDMEVETPSDKVCKYCEKGDLKWKRVMDKWLLYDGDVPHLCPNNPDLKKAIVHLENMVDKQERMLEETKALLNVTNRLRSEEEMKCN